MKLLVTGAAGGVGPWLIDELLRSDHNVVAVDRSAPKGDLKAHFVQVDLRSFAETKDVIERFRPEVVVHFGAIPAPGGIANHELFENNVLSTYHVLEAASLCDVRRTIFASSISAYGFAWADTPPLPRYLPVDEEHPLLAEDCYGLSKIVGEEACKAFTRKTGMDTICVRPPWITYPTTYTREFERLQQNRDTAAGRHLWAYCDVRDIARFVRLAAEHPGKLGHEAFIVTAADTIAEELTLDLVRSAFPDVPRDEARLDGRRSVFSNEKAYKLLGYRSRFGWGAPQSGS